MSIADLVDAQRRELGSIERGLFVALRGAWRTVTDALGALWARVRSGSLAVAAFVRVLAGPLDMFLGHAQSLIALHVATLTATASVHAVAFLPSTGAAVPALPAAPISLAEVRRSTLRLVRDAARLAVSSPRLPAPAALTIVRSRLDGALTRVLSIARTEGMRAYREVIGAAIAASADRLVGWTWRAALDRRACALCWSMHGTIHASDEGMASHVRCRCMMLPLLPGQAMGRTGAERFSSLPAADQRAILGPSKFEAYSRGLLGLEDVRGFATVRGVGRVGFERSLTGIVGPEWAAVFRGAAREAA